MINSNLFVYVVNIDASIEDAIVSIENNSLRSVIVVDSEERVVGTLSDGDIRKALLRHRILKTPVSEVMNMNFISVPPYKRDDAAHLFKKFHIFMIPVIDDNGHLIDIITAY